MLDLTGMPAFDLAIGLSFIFFLLALLATTIQEFIAAILGLRARTLEQGLRSLLEDPKVGWRHVDKFYEHELIKTLYRTPKPPAVKDAKKTVKTRTEALTTPAEPKTTEAQEPPTTKAEQEPQATEAALPLPKKAAKRQAKEEVARAHGKNAHAQSRNWFLRALGFLKRTKGPSYISPRSFALVVLDNFAPDENQKTIFDKGNKVLEGAPAAIRKRLKPLLAGAEADVEGLRTNLEAFYDDTMARVSGWYKRKTQIIVLVIGVVLVLAMNANAIKMGERMWKDDTVRAAVVAQAQATAAKADTTSSTGGTDETTDSQQLSEAAKKLNDAADDVNDVAGIGIPLGWRGEAVPHGRSEIAMAVGGWILTILAISLGAPFWFDALSKLSRLRSSGKPETPLPASGSGKINERVLTPPQVPTVVVQLHDRPSSASTE